MEHSVEFYRAAVRVIDYIEQGHTEISAEIGMEMAGGYWCAVGILFKEAGAARLFKDRSAHITIPFLLEAIREDCTYTIKVMGRADHDRSLDNGSKWVAIVCGILGFVISLVSICLAFMAYSR